MKYFKEVADHDPWSYSRVDTSGYIGLVTFLMLIITLLGCPPTLSEDIDVYDDNYRLQYRIRGDKVYDRNYKLQYRVDNGKVYDRDYRLKFRTQDDKVYDGNYRLRYLLQK